MNTNMNSDFFFQGYRHFLSEFDCWNFSKVKWLLLEKTNWSAKNSVKSNWSWKKFVKSKWSQSCSTIVSRLRRFFWRTKLNEKTKQTFHDDHICKKKKKKTCCHFIYKKEEINLLHTYYCYYPQNLPKQANRWKTT